MFAISALKEISESAQRCGLTVCMEWHNGRLKENIRTDWQPIDTYPENIRHIQAMKGFIESVHVYNWFYGETVIRLPLSANRADWEKYIDALGYRTTFWNLLPTIPMRIS